MARRHGSGPTAAPRDVGRPRSTGLRANLWPPAERRRRADLVIALAVLVVVVLSAAALWWRSDLRRSHLDSAASPVPVPAAAAAVPTALHERWRAADPAAPDLAPVVAGGVVVTSEGSTVRAVVAATGATAWTYARDRGLCGVTALGAHVVTVFRSGTGCGAVTEIDAATGTYVGLHDEAASARIELRATYSYVLLAGPDRLLTLRDYGQGGMVRNLEYGHVPTPVEPEAQPRAGCSLRSTLPTPTRVLVLESCPEEDLRLTVLRAQPENSSRPEVLASHRLGFASGRLVAAAEHRALAVLTPRDGPAALTLLDTETAEILTPAPRPHTGLPPRPPGPGDVTTTVPKGEPAGTISWWDGERTHLLDSGDLGFRGVVENALGPAVSMAGRILIPVPGGIAVLSGSHGHVDRVLPVARGDRGPVRLAVVGDVLVEKRGGELVALGA